MKKRFSNWLKKYKDRGHKPTVTPQQPVQQYKKIEFNLILDAIRTNATTSLDLSNNHANELEEIIVIAEALQHNKTITSINLKGNNIAFDGTKAIINLLKINKNITSVNLAYTCIGKIEIIMLAEVLVNNETIISLNLEGNNIEFDGAKAISEALQRNTAITSINLANTRMRIRELIILSEAFRVNKTIAHLDLSGNYTGCEGIIAITDALKVNNTIRSINLTNTHIGIREVIILSEVLKVNKTITYLGLDSNNIEDKETEIINDIQKRLSENIEKYKSDIIRLIDTLHFKSESDRKLIDAFKKFINAFIINTHTHDVLKPLSELIGNMNNVYMHDMEKQVLFRESANKCVQKYVVRGILPTYFNFDESFQKSLKSSIDASNSIDKLQGLPVDLVKKVAEIHKLVDSMHQHKKETPYATSLSTM